MNGHHKLKVNALGIRFSRELKKYHKSSEAEIMILAHEEGLSQYIHITREMFQQQSFSGTVFSVKLNQRLRHETQEKTPNKHLNRQYQPQSAWG